MPTPEGKVKDWLIRELRKRYAQFWYYKAPGGIYGRAGVPDLLCSINGYFVAIEVKTKKGQITRLQQIELDKLEAAGAFTTVCYGKDEQVFDHIDTWLATR